MLIQYLCWWGRRWSRRGRPRMVWGRPSGTARPRRAGLRRPMRPVRFPRPVRLPRPPGPLRRLPPPAASPLRKAAAGAAVLVALGGLAILSLDVLLWPTLRTLAQAEIKNTAVEIMYEAVRGEMSAAGLGYESLFRVETNEEGVVTLLQPNTMAVNDLAARSALAIKAGIGRLEGHRVYIPLGRAFGSRLFGGVGPRLPVTIYPLYIEDVTIWDTFEAAGINQTRHRIFLNVKLHSRTAIPFIETETVVEADFPVAEAVIVGPVPRTYFGGAYLPIFPAAVDAGGD